MIAVKINAKHITIAGKRIGVTYSAGPWVEGVDPALIKIRPRRSSFPAEMHQAFTIGDATTEHESFDAACGYARNELMLGRRPVIIEERQGQHKVGLFVMDTHGNVEAAA